MGMIRKHLGVVLKFFARYAHNIFIAPLFKNIFLRLCSGHLWRSNPRGLLPAIIVLLHNNCAPMGNFNILLHPSENAQAAIRDGMHILHVY